MASERLKAMLAALPPRRRRFVEAYLLEPNAKRAAISAGLAEASAEQTGSRMLRNDQVSAALALAAGERSARVEVQADDVLRELKTFSHANPAEAFDDRGRLLHISKMPHDLQLAIQSFEWGGTGTSAQPGGLTKVKFWPKHRGLEMLGRHIRLFGEEAPSSVTNVFQVNNTQMTVQIDYTRLSVEEHRQLLVLLEKAAPLTKVA